MSDQTPKPIDLSLTPTDGTDGPNGNAQQGSEDQTQSGPHGPQQGSQGGPQGQPENRPVMGYIAATFGLLSIFLWAIIFAPLGIVCSIIALFMGQGMWAFIGLALSIVGIISSPFWWGILGIAAVVNFLGF